MGSRAYTIRKKSRMVLDKSLFPFIQDLEIGQTGMMQLNGTVEGISQEMQEDNVERLVLDIRIDKLEEVNAKGLRYEK